jgi:hypothetical protein
MMTGHHYGGREWTSTDLYDLKHLVRTRTPLRETAQFLCRSEEEVDAKIAEMRLWDDRDAD